MSSLKYYYKMSKHIKNWTHYFRRLHEKSLTTQYITKPNQLRFDLPPNFYFVFREMFMEDFYRIDDLVKELPQTPTIVDIGANVGLFSFQILSKIANAKVFAYEPMEINANVFKHNVSLNPTLQKQVHIFQKAVTGNYTGSLNIYFDDFKDNSVIASVIAEFSSDNKVSKQVDAIKLSSIIADNNITKIDLLKLDCEGSEYPILYDSPSNIFDVIQAMALEVHHLDNEKRNVTFLTNFLIEKGYKVENYATDNDCPYLKVYK